MSFFMKLSIANKLALIGLAIAILTLYFTIIPTERRDNVINNNQETQGNNSPIINSRGDVNVRY